MEENQEEEKSAMAEGVDAAIETQIIKTTVEDEIKPADEKEAEKNAKDVAKDGKG